MITLCKYITFASAICAVLVFILILRMQSTTSSFASSVEINTNKGYLTNVSALKNQIYVVPPTDINADIGNSLKLEDVGNLNAEFQLKFIQQLQDAEIEDLKQKLKSIPGIPETVKPPVNSVKHLGTGKLFGVIKSPTQQGDQFSIIVDRVNAECLKYKPGFPVTDNIDLTACDINSVAPDQKFAIQTVTNNGEFNGMLLGSSAYEENIVADDYGFGAYPFSVIKPVVKGTNGLYNKLSPECITLNDSGLSVEPCTGKENQRFTPMETEIQLRKS